VRHEIRERRSCEAEDDGTDQLAPHVLESLDVLAWEE
jgi:hypothetical protein